MKNKKKGKEKNKSGKVEPQEMPVKKSIDGKK
jgi:hypothetical protein